MQSGDGSFACDNHVCSIDIAENNACKYRYTFVTIFNIAVTSWYIIYWLLHDTRFGVGIESMQSVALIYASVNLVIVGSGNNLSPVRRQAITIATQIATFMGPTWGPPGSCGPQMGPYCPPEPCYQGNDDRLPCWKNSGNVVWIMAGRNGSQCWIRNVPG